MGFAASLGRGCVGIGAPQVIVEVHTTTGLPGFSIVGLPETTVRESKERVRSAIINSGFEFPRRRITVNLAPAELPKPGTRFDLAIAVAIVAASGQIDGRELASHTLYAELGLDGTLRPVIGALPAALACRDAHQALILAHDNAEEAALVSTCVVLGAGTLLEVIEHLTGAQRLSPRPPPPGSKADAASLPSIANDPIAPDLSDVRGQDRAKRALEIAAAGGHNLLFIGPPGTGKTMLANRLPGLLPRLSDQHALELAAVLSVAGRRFDPFRWREPPFRAPHHSCSSVALIGGGVRPQPGEISLAHRGVLFLDELPEFDRRALEALREPLEAGRVSLSRAAYHLELPARIQLVCAMNPCPCGNLGNPDRDCRCTPEQIQRYHGRLSGPLLDRIDIRLVVGSPRHAPGHAARAARDDSDADTARGPNLAPYLDETPRDGARQTLRSHVVRERVSRCRQLQLGRAGELNADLRPAVLREVASLGRAQQRLLADACARFGLSERGRDRVLRLARTIADLAHSGPVDDAHLLEALSLRSELGSDLLSNRS